MIADEPPKPEYTAQPGEPECDVFVRQPNGQYGYVIRLPYAPADLVAMWNEDRVPDDIADWVAWKLATVRNTATGSSDLAIMDAGKAPWPLSAETMKILLDRGPFTVPGSELRGALIDRHPKE